MRVRYNGKIYLWLVFTASLFCGATTIAHAGQPQGIESTFSLANFKKSTFTQSQSRKRYKRPQARSPKPQIDGLVSTSEWALPSNRMSLPGGFLAARNDASTLYLFLDLTNVSSDPEDEAVAIYIDSNRDGMITRDADDLLYMFQSSEDGELVQGLMRLNDSSILNLIQSVQTLSSPLMLSTKAQVRRGFGATPISANPHLYWEISIPLSEIGYSIDKDLNIKIETNSTEEDDSQSPKTDSDEGILFKDLLTLRLTGNFNARDLAREDNKKKQSREIGVPTFEGNKVVLTFPDGKKFSISLDSGLQLRTVDSGLQKIDVQLITPPTLPNDHSTLVWLKAFSNYLSLMIDIDGREVQNFVNECGQRARGKVNPYEAMEIRLKCLIILQQRRSR
jgi:hypothetical protein